MEKQSNDLEGRLRSLIVSNARDKDDSSQVNQKDGNSTTNQAPKPVRGRGGRNRYRQKLDLGSTNSFHVDQRPENNHATSWQHSQGFERRRSFQPTVSQNSNQSPGPNRPSGGTVPRSRPSPFTPLVRPRAATPEELNSRGYYLERLAARELPAMEMSLQEFQEKDAFRVYLEELCQKAVSLHLQPNPPSVRLLSFGSMSSGFGMPGSDMDLALVTSHTTPNLFRILEKAFLEVGLGGRLLTRTRVPILKVCQTPTQQLNSALHDERRKWDEMTVAEQEDYDRPRRREENGADDGNGEAKRDKEEPQDTDAFEKAATKKQPTSKKAEGDRVTNGPSLEQEGEVSDPKPENNRSKAMERRKTSSIASERDPKSSGSQATTHQDEEQGSKEASTKLAANHQNGSQIYQNEEKKPREPRPARPWFREKSLGPLDFPKTGVGIQCDINFANPLGLHNTLLLRCYSHCDVRVRLMVLFVKAWASRRKINSSYNGTLSSYGYVLMVLHFLVNVACPYVCPNLQLCNRTGEQLAARPNTADPNAWCEGCDIRFWRNEHEIMDLAAKNMLTQNQEPLGPLLRDFFHYYALQGHGSPFGGFMWTRDVLSLRTPGGLLSKIDKGWTGAKTTMVEERKVRQRYLFAIEDPFELDHNVARTVTHNGICAIRDEFRRAWRMITDAGRGMQIWDDLFAEVISVKPKPEEPPQNDLVKADGADAGASNMSTKGGPKQPLQDTLKEAIGRVDIECQGLNYALDS